MKAVGALGHTNRNPTHLVREVKVGMRTFDAARAGSCLKGSYRLRNHAANRNLLTQHSAGIHCLGALGRTGIGLRNAGLKDLRLLRHILD